MNFVTSRKLLLFILLLGLALRMFLVWKQENAHVDNFWSFQIAAGNWGKGLPEDKWLHYGDFFRSFFVSRSSSTNYQLVKESSAKDVHPPLYYYVLHWVMALNYGQPHINLIYILGFIFYSISFILLYKLSFLILKSYPKVLFTLLLFSISFGTLSGFLAFRMYMLQTPLILGLMYLFFLQKEKKALNIYSYIAFGVLVFLASYTNYNSLIAIFLLSLVIAFHYWFVDKNLARIKRYFYTLGATAIFYIAVFPDVFRQISVGVDSRSSITGLLFGDWNKLVEAGELIQSQLFYGVLFIVLIYILIRIIYKSIKKGQSIKSRLFDPIKFDSFDPDTINMAYIFLFTIPLSMFILSIHIHDQMVRYIYFLTPYFFIWMAYYLPTFKKNIVIIAASTLFAIHSLNSIFNINYQSTKLNRNLPIHHLYWKNPMHDVYEKKLYILMKGGSWATGPIQYNAREKSLLYVSSELKWDIINSKDSIAVFVEENVDKTLKNELIENSYKKIGTYDSDIFINFDIFAKR